MCSTWARHIKSAEIALRQMLSGFDMPQQEEAPPTHTATSGRGELDAVDLTEAGGKDGGRGGVVAEPVGSVRCL